MKNQVSKFLTVLSIAGSFVALSGTAQACTGCRVAGEMVENQEKETVSAGVGLSWSVLFMLGTVTVLGSGMGVYIKRTIAQIDQKNSTYL